MNIDLRFIINIGSREIDVRAGEVAKGIEDEKVLSDESDLLREGKDVQDGLTIIALGDKSSKECLGMVLQLSAVQGEVSSVHLFDNGSYGAVPQRKLLPC